jgi:hypothetical protein
MLFSISMLSFPLLVLHGTWLQNHAASDAILSQFTVVEVIVRHASWKKDRRIYYR